MEVIVLISGRAGSGKSTLKDALIETLNAKGIKTTGLRFAQPVYEAHYAAQRAVEAYGIEYKEKDRVLLQVLGTEWGRNSRGEDVWVKALAYRANQLVHGIDQVADNYQVVVVDDCRFPNEKDYDFGLPTFTVRLECPPEVRKTRLGGALPPEHASEFSLDTPAVDFNWHLDSYTFTPQELATELAIEIKERLCRA